MIIQQYINHNLLDGHQYYRYRASTNISNKYSKNKTVVSLICFVRRSWFQIGRRTCLNTKRYSEACLMLQIWYFKRQLEETASWRDSQKRGDWKRGPTGRDRRKIQPTRRDGQLEEEEIWLKETLQYFEPNTLLRSGWPKDETGREERLDWKRQPK